MSSPDLTFEQREACGRAQHWVWTLEREIERFETVHRSGARLVSAAGGRYTREAQKAFSESAATQHWVAVSANHLRKALEQTPVRGRLSSDQLVRHLRNIYEHWEARGESASWYDDRFPGRTPWSSSWSIEKGTTIGGELHLEELKPELARLNAELHTLLPDGRV